MRTILSVFVGTLLCWSPAIAADTKTDLRNFHKVNDRLYRGAQPTPVGFQALTRLGVKTIIDLRGPEHSEAQEKEAVEALGMRYVSIPMKGMRTPSDSQISKALSIIDDPTSQPVFVHCRRGADRTGVVIACYRIQTQRWNSAEALKEASNKGMSWVQFALRKYVKGYAERTSAALDRNTDGKQKGELASSR